MHTFRLHKSIKGFSKKVWEEDEIEKSKENVCQERKRYQFLQQMVQLKLMKRGLMLPIHASGCTTVASRILELATKYENQELVPISE